MLSEELRKARLKAGLTQEELGYRARVTRNYVSMLELGQASPTVDTLLRICGAVGVRASGIIAKIERSRQKRS